jgi:hypothetical protein
MDPRWCRSRRRCPHSVVGVETHGCVGGAIDNVNRDDIVVHGDDVLTAVDRQPVSSTVVPRDAQLPDEWIEGPPSGNSNRIGSV